DGVPVFVDRHRRPHDHRRHSAVRRSACPAMSAPSSSAVFWRAGVSRSRVRLPEAAFAQAENDGRPVGQTGLVQLVNIDDIRAAAELIRPYVLRTPMVPARWADDDRPLWIKPENLQSI